MATVSFGTFAKRINSTKQPVSLSDQRTVTLKEDCSQDNPVFICTGNNFNYNYCMWDGKYYFIDDIISLRNNEIEIHCNMDVLATYKNEILATKAYVIYDTVTNTEIPDNRIPMKTTATVSASTAACPLVPDGGCYILSLTGAHNTTGIYKVTEAQLMSLIDDIQDVTDNIFDYDSDPSTPTWPSPPTPSGSIGDDIINSIIYAKDLLAVIVPWLQDWIGWWHDAIQLPISQIFGTGNIPENIRECRFIPFNRGTTGGSIPIYLGTFKTKTSLPKLDTDTIVASTSVSIPWQANDYRRRGPFTEIYIYLPYIGMVRLSAENLIGQSSISVSYTLSVRDGSLICTISAGNEILGQYNANVGASVPVGISNINIPRAAQSLIAGVAAASTGSIAATGMAAINFGETVTPNYSCIGGIDGIAATAANQNITCYTVFHDTVVAPNTEIATVGSPTMAPKALATLTGYCQCMDAHVEASATSAELSRIDDYLNSGFFIE